MKLKISEKNEEKQIIEELEMPFTHTVTDDEPDDTLDVFTLEEFEEWIGELMKES